MVGHCHPHGTELIVLLRSERYGLASGSALGWKERSVNADRRCNKESKTQTTRAIRVVRGWSCVLCGVRFVALTYNLEQAASEEQQPE